MKVGQERGCEITRKEVSTLEPGGCRGCDPICPALLRWSGGRGLGGLTETLVNLQW